MARSNGQLRSERKRSTAEGWKIDSKKRTKLAAAAVSVRKVSWG